MKSIPETTVLRTWKLLGIRNSSSSLTTQGVQGQPGTHKTHTKTKLPKMEPEVQARPELGRSGPVLSHWN